MAHRITMKIGTSLYLAMILVVVYYKADAMQIKDKSPGSCYQCTGSECEAGPPAIATCSWQRPYCASVASAPDYTSSLTCAAGGPSPCSLTYSSKQLLEMTCVCPNHLCNAPFSKDLQKELITFSSADISKNRTEFIDMFWKQSQLVNDDESLLYKKITTKVVDVELPARNGSEFRVWSTSASMMTVPRRAQPQKQLEHLAEAHAELLRRESTLPSDDEEDESEGSGSDDYGQAHAARTPPAQPSSRLPAEDSAAAYRPFLDFFAFIVTVPAFLFLL